MFSARFLFLPSLLPSCLPACLPACVSFCLPSLHPYLLKFMGNFLIGNAPSNKTYLYFSICLHCTSLWPMLVLVFRGLDKYCWVITWSWYANTPNAAVQTKIQNHVWGRDSESATRPYPCAVVKPKHLKTFSFKWKSRPCLAGFNWGNVGISDSR